MTNWQITPGMERITLVDGRAEVAFTVTNPGPVDTTATVEIVGSEQTDSSWFAVAEPQRVVPHGGSVPFSVVVRPSADAPVGRHWLAGRVYSSGPAPEETAVTSNKVSFEIPKEEDGGGLPRWLWLVVGGVLLVAVIVVLLIVFLGGGDEAPPTSPTTSPPPTPSAPELLSPADGAVLTNFPRDATVRWQPVPTASEYRVEVECIFCARQRVVDTRTSDTSESFTFTGDNEGRWRVTAILPDGTELASQWRSFRFRTGPQ